MGKEEKTNSKKSKLILVIVIIALTILCILKWKKKFEQEKEIAKTKLSTNANTFIRNQTVIGKFLNKLKPSKQEIKEPTNTSVYDERTIFVAIVSGLDQESQTLKCICKMFERATFPNRIMIGVCQTIEFQKGKKRGQNYTRTNIGYKSDIFSKKFLSKYKKPNAQFLVNNIRVLEEPSFESKGFSNSMYLIQQFLFRNEKFFMTLDNKLLVDTLGWDTEIISNLKRCGKANSYHHSIITCKNASENNETLPTFILATSWSQNGTPILDSRQFQITPTRPFQSIFYSSCFSFSSGKLIQTLKYDPWYQHINRDDVDWVHCIRLWTHGYQFFSPINSFIKTNSNFASVENKPTLNRKEQLELNAGYNRLWTFLEYLPHNTVNIEKKYSIGNTKSIEQFIDFSGVDWKQRIIYPQALIGMSLKNFAGSSIVCNKNFVDDFYGLEKNKSKKTFEDDEVIAKYGSWSEFFETTDYTENMILRG